MEILVLGLARLERARAVARDRGAWAAMLPIVAAMGAGCADKPCTPEPCDVRTIACQEATLASAACLSGVDVIPVPVEIIDRQTYLAKYQESFREDDLEGFGDQQAGLALLGLAPDGETLEGYVEARGSSTAGAYWHEDATIYLIEESLRIDPRADVSLLVHEYTHALQFGIAGRMPEQARDTLDSHLAWAATVEGEATLNGDRALLLMLDVSLAHDAWERIYRYWMEDILKAYADEARKVTMARSHFAYLFGSRWLKDKPTGATLPLASSTGELMLGGPLSEGARAQAWVPEGSGEVLDVDELGQFVIDGWFGQALAAAGTELVDLPPMPAVVADTLTLLRTDNDALRVIWRIDFAAGSPQALASLEAALNRAWPGTGAGFSRLEGDSLLVFAGQKASVIERFRDESPAFVEQPFEDVTTDAEAGAHAHLMKSCGRSHKEEHRWDLLSLP